MLGGGSAPGAPLSTAAEHCGVVSAVPCRCAQRSLVAWLSGQNPPPPHIGGWGWGQRPKASLCAEGRPLISRPV